MSAVSSEKFGRNIRHEFYLREKSVFVNHGSSGTAPRRVLDYKIRLEKELESHPDDWFRRKLEPYFRKTVVAVAKFLHTEPQDTFMVQNVTKGFNTVLKSYPLEAGDAILVSSLAYTAVVNTAGHTAKTHTGAELVTVKITFPIESEDQLIRAFEETVEAHPSVKLAVIDHITSSSAIVLPVKRLTEVLHKHGIVVVIDGAHAPGQVSLDLPDIDADFYTGNFHKWAFTPKGCGFLWRNPKRAHDWLRPLVTSNLHGFGLMHEFGYEGTKDDSVYFSVDEAFAFVKDLGGFEEVTSYNRKLKEEAVRYLSNSWGMAPIEVPGSMVAPCMQLVRMPRIPPGYGATQPEADRLMTVIFERFDIQTYAKCIQGDFYIRVSVQIYNAMEDFVQLDNAIQEMLKSQ